MLHDISNCWLIYFNKMIYVSRMSFKIILCLPYTRRLAWNERPTDSSNDDGGGGDGDGGGDNEYEIVGDGVVVTKHTWVMWLLIWIWTCCCYINYTNNNDNINYYSLTATKRQILGDDGDARLLMVQWIVRWQHKMMLSLKCTVQHGGISCCDRSVCMCRCLPALRLSAVYYNTFKWQGVSVAGVWGPSEWVAISTWPQWQPAAREGVGDL